MIATKVLESAVQSLLAADTTTLAPAVNALHVHLIQAPFTPDSDTDFTTLTEADFTGGAAKAAGVGACQTFSDPITLQLAIQLNEPVGGWHWKATALTNLPQTIYGYVVTDNADAVTYGSALFPSPFPILAINDGVDIPFVRLELSGSALDGYAP